MEQHVGGSLGPGAALGPYRIVRELGRGGMGAVFEAEDSRVARRVALKVLLGKGDAARFLVEARACARLSHRNLVKVHEVGEVGEVLYMALELVPGTSLDARLKTGGAFAPDAAARIARDLARGLAYAHDQGVLHRDLKPANVLLTPEGEPRLTDFGLAKAEDAAQALTKTGDLLGTPSYMAPEQADGLSKQADARVDVYGLGATLYCLLTGRPPFVANSLPSLLTRVLSKPAAPPSTLAPTVPAALDAITLRCLEKEPAARYPDMRALADDLDRFLEGELQVPPPSPVPWILLAVGLLVAVAGAAGALAGGGEDPPAPLASADAPGPAATSPAPSPAPGRTRRAKTPKTARPLDRRRSFAPSEEDMRFLKKDYAGQLRRSWQLRAKTGPKPRTMIQHGMTYDPDRGVVWLFGGRTRGGYTDELWSWDGTSWTPTEKSGPWPAARGHHVLVYDSGRDVLVLWGGREGPDTKGQSAVWEFGGGRWQRFGRAREWPSSRSRMAAAYDPDAGRVVIFGGMTSRDGRLSNELWGWNGRQWTPLPAGPTPISARSSAGLIYDARNKRLLAYGGLTDRLKRDLLVEGKGTYSSSSVWSHDGRRWKKLPAPTSSDQTAGHRSAHTWVAASGQAVCFGGRIVMETMADDKTHQDTWLYREGGWHGLIPRRSLDARSFHGSAYDAKRRRVVVFGGSVWRRKQRAPAALYGDTWEYPVGKAP